MTQNRKRSAQRSVASARIRAAWSVYIVECLDGTLYTGMTRDLPCRLAAHNEGRGARYTQVHPPGMRGEYATGHASPDLLES